MHWGSCRIVAQPSNPPRPSPVRSPRLPSLPLPFSYALSLRLPILPQGARVWYDEEEDEIHWPLLFLYPEVAQSDFLQDFVETESLMPHLLEVRRRLRLRVEPKFRLGHRRRLGLGLRLNLGSRFGLGLGPRLCSGPGWCWGCGWRQCSGYG